MCGIAGYIDFSKRLEINNLNNILNLQNLRGPENKQIKKINDNIFLGHNRLKIIDLRDAANQPFTSNSGNLSIVFNGEIYNFSEIKKLLSGYQFKTLSDTEVILASIEIHGIDWFLERANGMFAFAIIDLRKRTISLCRDRFGVKPLYYYLDKSTLLFASNPKAIYQQNKLDIKINKQALSEYLSYRYVRSPKSFFTKINQLESGTYLTIEYSNEKLESKKTKYYNLPNFNSLEDFKCEESDLESKVHELIYLSVKRRLVADVKVGSYLSGGVDSSLVAAIAATIQGKNLSTYTVGTSTNNEFKYARKIANIYKTDHHEILYSKDDYFNEWPKLIKEKGGPLGVPNEVPLSLMTKALSNDITVVLSGEGADELFGGYGRIFRLPYHTNDNEFHDSFFKKYEYMNSSEQKKLGLEDVGLINSELQNKILNQNIGKQEFIFNYFQNFHIEGLLQRLDTSTMRWSIEAREPFLDIDLIDFVYSKVPLNYKLKWKEGGKLIVDSEQLNPEDYSEIYDTPKYLLKKVSERYLPKEIIYRRKEGFPIELQSWNHDLINMFKSLYYDQNIIQLNNENLNDFLINKNNSQKIWMLNNILMFIKDVK